MASHSSNRIQILDLVGNLVRQIMLACPSPPINVKSDHPFQTAALPPHQHLSIVGASRAPFNSYYHNAPQLRLNTELIRNCTPNFKLLTSADQVRLHDAVGMEKRPLNISQASFSHSHQTTNSVSPPPLQTSSGYSACRAFTQDNYSGGRRHLHSEGDNDIDESHAPCKRPRPASFSQLETRSSEKYGFPDFVSSGHTPPNGFSPSGPGAGVGLVIKEEDVNSLPPIITREEREHDASINTTKLIVQVPPLPHSERHKTDSTTDSDENLENSSSSNKPIDSNSNQLPMQLSSFPGPCNLPLEQYDRNQTNHHAPATPHSASSLSLASQQQAHFSNHPTGYLSAIPSSLPSHSNVQHVVSNCASYPGSPTLTMNTPNSATFPSDQTSSLSPHPSQLGPPSCQSHHLTSPSSPHFRNSATVFPPPPTGHLVGSPYPSGSPAQGLVGLPPPSTRVANVVPSNSSTNASTGTPQWGGMEGQPPRRRGKLPQAVTAILKTWLMAHTGHPYPTEEEKKSLCEQTQLNMNQVSNWFINARRRILVPPTGTNSVHVIRQTGRRQAQSQLSRATANTGMHPPGLHIHNLNHQALSGSPLNSPTIYSPASATSPGLSNGATFEFRCSLPSQSQPSEPFQSGVLPIDRMIHTTPSSTNQWSNSIPNSLRPSTTCATYSGVSAPHGGSVAYFPSHSSYAQYSASQSGPSTPLLPHHSLSYSGYPSHYPITQQRVHSPRCHPNSHPSTPTVSHSYIHRNQAGATYISHASSESVSHTGSPQEAQEKFL
ncbi:hypothetical protein O181_062393 [Austropuccinia psidii MF-1]|uniref:Homeobox domain-containing protein n=1 Tax=Austropuccinia psidii MF-1 TaxID=1389203 RepID=A0A9Q3EJM3_9BASI|nr:hypothetical protein [Austropuccinia psidii MF-1]